MYKSWYTEVVTTSAGEKEVIFVEIARSRAVFGVIKDVDEHFHGSTKGKLIDQINKYYEGQH